MIIVRLIAMKKQLISTKKGELVKLYLMSLEFGGEDSPVNTFYVPEFAQQFK